MKEILTHARNRYVLFFKNLFCLFLFCPGATQAQTTLSTTGVLTNTDTAAIVTFNFQNTNTYPVLLTELSGILNAYGASNVQLWYKNTAISGSPGAIATGNGWTMAASGSVMGIANSGNTNTQTLLGNVNLLIPAGSTYGIAVAGYAGSTGTLRIDAASGTAIVSDGGCTISLGTGAGFSGNNIPPAAPAETPRGWLGKLSFIPGSNCTGTPGTPVISGPSNICPSKLFILSATGYSMGPGISYQWQYFNTASSTWADITGATDAASYTATAGIAAATQFRLRTNCSFTSTQSLSNTITVNTGAGLLSGVYTVDKNAPSTATNFTSLRAVAAALSCGISGPVTFNVTPGSGPYEEQVVFGKIPGSGTTNRIRLNGNGAIVQHTTTDTEPGIVLLRSTSYMTIDSLNIRSLNPAGICVGYLFTDTLGYDSLTRCFVDMSSLSFDSLFPFSSGIEVGGYNWNNDSSAVMHSYFGHNYVLGTTEPGGLYYGMTMGTYSAIYTNNIDSNNTFDHNLIENTVHNGIHCRAGINKTRIINNEIHNKNKAATPNVHFIGIYCRRYWWDGADSANTMVEISGNRIHDPAPAGAPNTYFTGIVASTWLSLSQVETIKFHIFNNAIYNIYSDSPRGIYIYNDDIVNNEQNDSFLVYHNTISLSSTNSSTKSWGIFFDSYWNTSLTTLSLKNNLITIKGNASATAAKYGIDFSNLNDGMVYAHIDQQRNNIYINTQPANNEFYVKRNTTSYATQALYQAAYPGQEAGSLTVDPQYTSEATGDLTPTNMALLGNGINLQSLVPRDINGRFRPTTPMPGAFEIGRDAGVTTLLSPIGTYCSSVKTVSVSIKNHGILPISAVQIGWSLNGALQTPVSYSSALAPGNSASIVLGTGLFLPNTPVEIKAWTSMPNGQVDAVPSNDTLIISSQCSSSIPVSLGADDTICTGNTYTLDAGYPGWAHTWDDNSNGQTRTVSAAGTYYVRVTALDGCLGFDTFTLNLRPLPVVDLGPDRAICWGTTTTFDAGHPGATYLWDDTSTAQTRTVDTAGYYEVQVTDIHGCKGVDNAEVLMKDSPAADGINATHTETGLYTFYPLNPRYAITYYWNFGDGSPEKEGYFVQHAYTALGIYTVTMRMVGECTGLIISISRTVDVFVLPDGTTGIGQTVAEGDVTLYPNPSSERVTLLNNTNGAMKRIVVYNVLGQTITDQTADSKTKHELNVSGLASGMYTVRIETDKGSLLRKFEVQR